MIFDLTAAQLLGFLFAAQTAGLLFIGLGLRLALESRS
jgi:hypothetical protein